MKAYAYIRVSTTEQGQNGLSLANQEEKIRHHCASRDIELVEVFSDEKSAKDTNRPGYTRMLEGLSSGTPPPADLVVVYKLDRIYRSTIDTLQGITKLKGVGVGLCSINENLDTSSAMGEFIVTLLAGLAQMERKLIGERTRDVMAKMRRDGVKTGPPPYGWKEIPGRAGKPEIDRDVCEQAVITRLLGLRDRENPQTYRSLALMLNAERVPPPRADLLRNGKRSTGMWHASTVRCVLERARKERERERARKEVSS